MMNEQSLGEEKLTERLRIADALDLEATLCSSMEVAEAIRMCARMVRTMRPPPRHHLDPEE
jgi:hypothetical protein